jgi:deoxyribonucleoside regulator
LIHADRDFLIEVAKKYYLEGLSQQEIAGQYSISRPSVSNLLKRCRDEGIVEIRIAESFSSQASALADRLRRKFLIEEIAVVPSENVSSDPFPAAAVTAAELLKSRLRDGVKIGLSWGSSIYQVVEALTGQNIVDAEVVQLTGSLGLDNPSFDGFDLVRNLAQKLNGRPNLLQAPLLVKNPEVRQALISEHPLAGTMSLMGKLDLALVGMSSDVPELSAMVKEGFLSLQEAGRIMDAGGVGHICGLHYDRDGHFIDDPQNKRVIGISPEDFMQIPRIIGVAWGEHKAEAIAAAMRGGLIHSLVTDQKAALRILGTK